MIAALLWVGLPASVAVICVGCIAKWPDSAAVARAAFMTLLATTLLALAAITVLSWQGIVTM